MFRPQETVAAAAAAATRALRRLSRPSGRFDASRYFRGSGDLGFYNTGTAAMRALAREIYLAQRDLWTVGDAIRFADILIRDRHLETKSVGVEVLAQYRRDLPPRLLAVCHRWLAKDYSANWATTDTICGLLIGPLLVQHPELIPLLRGWAGHRNLWVRRASIVGLLVPMRRGHALDQAYSTARRLHADPHDLIHKAVGWALREAGKIDESKLERYLRAGVGAIPRTTFRYAIERFAPARRKQLLALRPQP